MATGLGILDFNAATADVEAAAYTANKVINNKNDLEKKKLENEDYLNRTRLMGEQQQRMFEARSEGERRIVETKGRNEIEKTRLYEEYKLQNS